MKSNVPNKPLSDSAVVSLPDSAVDATGTLAPVRRAKKATVITLAVCGTLAAVAGVGAAAAMTASRRAAETANVMANGVRVADIVVGGMTKEEASEKVRSWAKTELTTHTVSLVAPESKKRFMIPLAGVGGRFDTDKAIDEAFAVGKDENIWQLLLHNKKSYDVSVKPAFRIDEKALTKQLTSIGAKVRVAPVNARAEMVDNVLQVTKPEQKGIDLDVPATQAAVLKEGMDTLRDGVEVPLTITETAPKVTSENLGQVSTLLGSFSTDFSSSSESRQSNIRKAAGKMNGTLLAPGEVFSYNDIVGPRLRRLGWRDAPTYQDGQVVPGPGGGICQTSTTLYNAALRAGLKILERQNHSMTVHYVPAGCDATVDYGNIDFRFANSTPGPLYVQARSAGGRLTFNLFGVPEAYPGKIDVTTGEHHSNSNGGFSVSSYRVIHAPDGTVKNEFLATSYYRPAASRVTTTPRPRRRRPTPAATPAPTAPAVAAAPTVTSR